MPYQVEATPYGIRTSHSGYATPEEAVDWLEQCRKILGEPHSFGQLVDLRGHKPNSPEVNEIVQEHMRFVRGHGLVRSAVVLSGVTSQMQIKRLAKETGMYEWERYLNAEDPEWERKAVEWIDNGTDPDL